MTYTSNNINEFFENLMNKPNAKVHMLHVYDAYEREREESKKIQEVEERYENDYLESQYTAHKVSDDIYIVTETTKGVITGYFAHVNGKKSDVLWYTFEQALLAAISVKLTG